jgi:[1-hydroxy-2-(trimethylamino)ethyl]phosphonate dioxygenase
MDLAPLFDLLARKAGGRYDGEDITQLEHALQSAWRAEQDGASPSLVTAALFHDVGHVLHEFGEDATRRGIDDRHEHAGAAFLARWFDEPVCEPVRLHVEAKRHLCAVDPFYRGRMSAESLRSLELQGGPLGPNESAEFVRRPYSADAIAIRRWDEAAKVVGLKTPPIEHFRAAAEAVRREE